MRLKQVIPNKRVTNSFGDVGDLLTGSVFVGEITSLPGCSDVAVSHAMYCTIGKGRGNALKALQLREAQCRELGYAAMICTVIDGNVAQEKTLTKAGYTKSLTYKSPRTGNTINLWSKAL